MLTQATVSAQNTSSDNKFKQVTYLYHIRRIKLIKYGIQQLQVLGKTNYLSANIFKVKVEM